MSRLEMYRAPIFLVDVTNKVNEKYKQQIPKYGHSWRDCDISYLALRLKDEMDEYFENPSDEELVDIINLATMILARRLGHGSKIEALES